MLPTLIAIDFSHFVSMCWYPALDAQEADPALYKAEEVVLRNVDGKLGTLRDELGKYGVEYRSYQITFVEDRHAVRKYELFPEYKANRDRSKPKPPKAEIKAYLKAKGYENWAWSEDNEADDAIAAFVKSAHTNNFPVIIISGDKDLWQLIEPPKVTLFNPYTNRFVQDEDVQKKFGVSSPKLIPLVKALWGDSGDNVPNVVPRMQKQLIPLIEKTDGSWWQFEYTVGDSLPILSKRCEELWLDGVRAAAINYELVKLDPDCKLSFDEQ